MSSSGWIVPINLGLLGFDFTTVRYLWSEAGSGALHPSRVFLLGKKKSPLTSLFKMPKLVIPRNKQYKMLFQFLKGEDLNS